MLIHVSRHFFAGTFLHWRYCINQQRIAPGKSDKSNNYLFDHHTYSPSTLSSLQKRTRVKSNENVTER
jgi:hypothetical protein